jgi:uncharacterized membrane protein
MGTLSQAKTLGGVGAILGLLSVIPFAGPVISIVGLVLVLIAIKYISDIVGNKSIFNNMIISVILAIVGVVVGFAFVIAAIARFVGLGILGSSFIRGQYSGSFNPSTLPPSDLFALIGSIIAGLVVVWVFFIISAVFVRRSYGTIATSLGVGMFSTSALLYLIGAALIIVFGIGFILMFVAAILEIVAFFSIPDQLPQPMQKSQTPMAPAPPTTISPAQVA